MGRGLWFRCWLVGVRMNLSEPIALLALVGVAYGGYACTTIGHEPAPSDWPKLEVHEHRVPHKVMRDVCEKYTSIAASPEACAEVKFKEGRCDIWLSSDFPPPAWVVEHEREHCLGKDHIGATTLRDAWEAEKAGK